METTEPVKIKQEQISPTSKDIAISQDADTDPSKQLHQEEENMEDEEEEDTKPVVLTHKAAMEEFKECLTELILGDNLLGDLPTNITLEEVNSLIALEHGRAITVNIRRGDESVLPVVVSYTGTVQDLKKALRRHVALKQLRENGTLHISWRYIWRTYWLYFDGQKLTEDHKKLKDYGITNKDEVTFLKKLKNK